MVQIDLSRPWAIIAPATQGEAPAFEALAGTTAATELAAAIASIRSRARIGLGRIGLGHTPWPPPIVGASDAAPPEDTPIFLLNTFATAEDVERRSEGFSWRAGENRVEIYGDSGKGVLNGTMDFLEALGFRWPSPQWRVMPPGSGAVLHLGRAGSMSSPRFSRRILSLGCPPQNRSSKCSAPKLSESLRWIGWAGRNRLNGLSVGSSIRSASTVARLAEEARRWGMTLELSLPEASRLAALASPLTGRPGRFVGGRRIRRGGLCATDPSGLEGLKKGAARWLSRMPQAEAYLFSTVSPEKRCSCPSCRAFLPEEQSALLADRVARSLGKQVPRALLIMGREEQEEDAEDQTVRLILKPQEAAIRRREPDLILSLDSAPKGETDQETFFYEAGRLNTAIGGTEGGRGVALQVSELQATEEPRWEPLCFAAFAWDRGTDVSGRVAELRSSFVILLESWKQSQQGGFFSRLGIKRDGQGAVGARPPG